MTMKSQKFREVSTNYINNELIPQQKQDITKKLYAMVRKWHIDTAPRSFFIFSKLCEYIETHPKFKLPWTVVEVKEAGESFCSWFKVYNLYV